MTARIEPNFVAIVDCAGSLKCELNEWCKSCDDGYYERPGLVELDQFPRTALGQTDRLGHDRDESEARRAGAMQSELTCTELVSDVPAGPICPLCNVPYGSWSPVHTRPGEARPCQWSWDVQKKRGAR